MRRPTIVLSLLFVLFATPGVAAYFFYKHPEWIASRTNHGHLLQPPQILTQIQQTKKWTLLYWSPKSCGKVCLQHIDDLAKLRLALGRHLYDVDLVLASLGAMETLKKPQRVLKDLDGHLLELDDKSAELLGKQSAIFLANPQRYLILSYSSNQAVKDIFQDLQKMVRDK